MPLVSSCEFVVLLHLPAVALLRVFWATVVASFTIRDATAATISYRRLATSTTPLQPEADAAAVRSQIHDAAAATALQAYLAIDTIPLQACRMTRSIAAVPADAPSRCATANTPQSVRDIPGNQVVVDTPCVTPTCSSQPDLPSHRRHHVPNPRQHCCNCAVHTRRNERNGSPCRPDNIVEGRPNNSYCASPRRSQRVIRDSFRCCHDAVESQLHRSPAAPQNGPNGRVNHTTSGEHD